MPDTDLLTASQWRCLATAPGACASPGELDPQAGWPAQVPGTAASALRAAAVAGWRERDYDAEDWWFLTSFESEGFESEGFESEGPELRLVLDGVATLCEVFCNGSLIFESQSMFVPGEVVLAPRRGRNELALCCRALSPRLAKRAGRPRWRNTLVERQSLRAIRTTLLGRMPGWAGHAAPVGPWRPLRLEHASPAEGEGYRLRLHRLNCRLEAGEGVVEIDADLLTPPGLPTPASVLVELAGCRQELALESPAQEAGGAEAARGGRLRATCRLPGVAAWFPHTHGEPRRHRGAVLIGDDRLELPAIGFRSVSADRRDDDFALSVNGVAVFARGACWVPPDAVSLAAGAAATRAGLAQLREAGCNLVRVTGTMVYEDESFFEACDELGILVWQDCMLANLDPPEDSAFTELLDAELSALFRRLGAHPSLAVICGGSEIEQQGAMGGAARGEWTPKLLSEQIPALAAHLLPGVPYLPSTPTGGSLPFQCDRGVAHYFGVGAYLRPLEDARRAGVRFAAECLAFATPPEPATVDELLGGASRAGHHPDWKQAVPRDGGASWDFEDVRDAYVEQLFGIDARRMRITDPGRALELGRAAVAECFAAVLGEWRRPGSGCAGAVVLAARDLVPGAGWGLIDAAGRPKAPWYVLRRACSPIALLLTDEGLNGLRLHILNDTPLPFLGRIEVSTWRDGEQLVERGGSEIEVGPAGGRSLDAAECFEGFRDLTYAYRFGPPGHDVVLVELLDEDGMLVADAVHLPLGRARPVESDLGLSAVILPAGQGPAGGTTSSQAALLECSTRRFAQWVAIDAAGWVARDSWFHLAPGRSRRVQLLPEPGTDPAAAPRGELRALNLAWPTRFAG